MRTMRRLPAAGAILCCALAVAPTQHAASPFYYHWLDRNTVYLWRTEADPRPVIATQGKGGWAVDAAAKTDAAWAAVVRASVPNVPAGADLWPAFLKRLRDEQPDDDWARVRKPDLQVYLRTRSSERVVLTYVRDGAAEDVELTKRDNKWVTADAERLSKLFSEHPDETRALLGARDVPPQAAQLLAAWGAWLDAAVNPNTPAVKLLPVQKAGGPPVVVWQERLSEAEWNRRVNLLKPAAAPSPSPPAPADARRQEEQRRNPPPPYRAWGFILISLVGVAGLLWAAWLSFIKPWRSGRLKAARPALAAKQSRKRKGQADRDVGAGDGGAFASAYEEFMDTFGKNFKQFLSQLHARSEEERAALLRESGLDGRKPGETRDLIQLGEAALVCYGSLERAGGVYGREWAGLFPMRKNQRQWLAELPEFIQSAASELRDKKEQAASLGDEVNRQKEIINRQDRQLSEAEAERTELIRIQEELRRALAAATQRGEDSQVVIDAVVKVSAFANNFQQGLRYYLDGKKDAGTMAGVFALINYSLAKLCLGYAEQHAVLVDAMLVNLYNISERLQNVHGFTTAMQEMEKGHADIKARQQRLVTSDKRHADDVIFQVLLKHLREQGRVDLAPFYFAVDQEMKVHYAN